MKGQVAADLIERVDDKHGDGFTCMKLIKFLVEDDVKDMEKWEKTFAEARKGDCPYHSRCPIYKRTVKNHPPKQLEMKL